MHRPITRSLKTATQRLPFGFMGLEPTYYEAGSLSVVHGDLNYNLIVPLNPPADVTVRAIANGDVLSLVYNDVQVFAYA